VRVCYFQQFFLDLLFSNYTLPGLLLLECLQLYPKGYKFLEENKKYTPKGIIMNKKIEISKFVKAMRKKVGLTQKKLSERAGVGLRFIREMEQGKQTLQMDKVNQVLLLFGHKLGPVKINMGDENE
jgi:y4mF family transcriptional regulator